MLNYNPREIIANLKLTIKCEIMVRLLKTDKKKEKPFWK